MILLSPEAEAQIDDLRRHYEQLDRPEAIRNLIAAIEDAAALIERSPLAGLKAPRPYPALAPLGFRWIKAGVYWFAYADALRGWTIAGEFYETADIPNRL